MEESVEIEAYSSIQKGLKLLIGRLPLGSGGSPPELVVKIKGHDEFKSDWLWDKLKGWIGERSEIAFQIWKLDTWRNDDYISYMKNLGEIGKEM